MPIWILVYCLLGYSCGQAKETKHIEIKMETQEIPFRLLKTYERSNNSFTQGFYYYSNNRILESSGLYGNSFILYYNLISGKTYKLSYLPKDIFAEGLTYKKPYIYLLTWKEHKCIVLDTNFNIKKTVDFHQEGWGITHDSSNFIVSNGSDSLYFYDQNFQFKRSLGVFYPENNVPVRNLNELEYVNGFIFANIWQQDRIVKINPHNGEVEGYLNLSSLIDAYINSSVKRDQDAVLNGIAWDKEQQLMYLTGKYWPVIFAIRLL